MVPDKKQEFYSLFCNIVVTQMLDYIGQRPYDRSRDKRILLALDEFASLRHLEILGPMRKFRKNGANICILTQSLADIDLEYSRDERKVILDNCTYTVVLSGNDPETRTYFSDLGWKRGSPEDQHHHRAAGRTAPPPACRRATPSIPTHGKVWGNSWWSYTAPAT